MTSSNIESAAVNTATCPVCRTGHSGPPCPATPRDWLAALNLRMQFEPDYVHALHATADEFGLATSQIFELDKLYKAQDDV